MQSEEFCKIPHFNNYMKLSIITQFQNMYERILYTQILRHIYNAL